MKFTHYTLLFAFCLVLATPAAARGGFNRDAAAEKFVQTFTKEMVSIVTSKKKSFAVRSAEIRTLLRKRTATQKVVVFMLGRYARKINRAQLPQYLNLMEDYAMRIFVNRMLYAQNAHTAKISIVASKKRGSKEVLVTSRLSVADLKNPLQVRWHLLRDARAGFKIFNLGVEGFWLAQEQRSQFTNYIQKNGGDPAVLLPFLRKKIAQAENDTRIRSINAR